MKAHGPVLSLAVTLAAFAAAPLTADDVPPGSGPKVGDRCNAGDPSPRPGLICRPAFTKISGQLHEEWELDPGHVLNGRKGDAVLSPGCGLVANLLRKVDPPQKYSHTGIMVQDGYKIRHSTASEDRIFDYGLGDPPGASGAQEHALKFGWPGTITQSSVDAFEGAFFTDPQNGESYKLTPFNPTPVGCGDSGDLIPATILKPPPSVDADAGSGARTRLNQAADEAQSIKGHYRFFGYTEPNDVLYKKEFPGNWADGTVGSVCSALVWRSMKDAGFTLEGSELEPEDITERGVAVDGDTPDGMYLYTVTERTAAADFLYEKIYDLVFSQAGPIGELIFDAADDTANQVLNCFGFDWCGETFTPQAEQAGCDPNDASAQDSPCWLNEGPGKGHAVSPDNLMAWDTAPSGPYGYREDLQYQSAEFTRVYRWGPDAGTATVKGKVTDGGAIPKNTIVHIEGLYAMDVVDASGGYSLEAVPAGPWTLRACSSIGRGSAAILSVPSSGTLTKNLSLGPNCNATADPGNWKRKVRIHGVVKVVDTEDFGDDEIDYWPLDETIIVQPNTEGNPNLAHGFILWDRCTGDEVTARLQFIVDLNQNDRSVHVQVPTTLYEGDSCDDHDQDGFTKKEFNVAPGTQYSLIYDMESEEWNAQDNMHISLSIDNLVAP